jgi:hypothetical protein
VLDELHYRNISTLSTLHLVFLNKNRGKKTNTSIQFNSEKMTMVYPYCIISPQECRHGSFMTLHDNGQVTDTEYILYQGCSLDATSVTIFVQGNVLDQKPLISKNQQWILIEEYRRVHGINEKFYILYCTSTNTTHDTEYPQCISCSVIELPGIETKTARMWFNIGLVLSMICLFLELCIISFCKQVKPEILTGIYIGQIIGLLVGTILMLIFG